MKRYQGTRSGGAAKVKVDGRALDPQLGLRNHSPTGFEWGYAGSGPAQLALAVLADHLGDAESALDLYQEFKFAVVARLPREGWVLTSADIANAITNLRSRTLDRNGPNNSKAAATRLRNDAAEGAAGLEDSHE